jgi:hypothetical protein
LEGVTAFRVRRIDRDGFNICALGLRASPMDDGRLERVLEKKVWRARSSCGRLKLLPCTGFSPIADSSALRNVQSYLLTIE